MAQCIEIHETTYAVGLFWQTLSSVKDQSRELRQISDDLGLSHACMILYPALQAGLADENELEGTSRPISLAAKLVGVRGGSWIGVYPLGPDRYYYIAVREDVILPEGDRVGDKASVEAWLTEHLCMDEASWDGLYGPEGFADVDEWTSESLSSLLAEHSENEQARVKPVRFRLSAPIRMMAAVVVLAGTLWWASHLLMPATPEHPPEARQAAIQTIEHPTSPEDFATVPEASSKSPVMVSTPPWKNMPLPDRFLSRCEAHFAKGRLHVAGWRLSQWQCHAEKSTSVYEREITGASIQMLKQILSGATMVMDGQRARAVRAMTHPSSSSSGPAEHPDVRWELQDRLRRLGYPVSFTEDAGDSLTWDPATEPFQTYHVQWEMDVSPFGLGTLLDSFAGFYLSSIHQSYKPSQVGPWMMRGTLYVKE